MTSGTGLMGFPLCLLRTAGGLNNSLRSGKLDRNRVSRVSMGSSKMIDEDGVICFRSFFRDAGRSTATRLRQDDTDRSTGKCTEEHDFVTVKELKVKLWPSGRRLL